MTTLMEERFLESTYLDKGTRFSASTLTKPDYQLWVMANAQTGDDMPRRQIVGFKSAIGSAWHEFVEKKNEPGVVKEFSAIKDFNGTTIGGTADELWWDSENKEWQIRDHKTKGVYSAKKFLGIGTKANPNPMPENEKEIIQLSIYRWMFQDMFPSISDTATIYLWVMGHTARESFPEVSEVELKLWDVDKIEDYVTKKIAISELPLPPTVDCDKNWMCDYCDVCQVCPDYLSRHHADFSDES